MRVIWKFPLTIDDEQTILVPAGAKLLCVQTQGEKLCIWALVNPDELVRWPVTVKIFGTGHRHPEKDFDDFAYLGSAQQLEGTVVWHVFVDEASVSRVKA